MKKPKRVLVVDDNQDIVATTVFLLRDMGHDSEGCLSGQEALEFVQTYDPDVVVMDLAMPGISGFEVAQQIRQRFPGPRPVLIAVTGELKGPLDLMLSNKSGFDHYILKPADPKTLEGLIDQQNAKA